MSGDWSKLPRWAQTEMANLEANLRSVTAERDAVLQGAGAVPRIAIGTGPTGGPVGYLPATWRVRFVFGERHDKTFDAHLEGETLLLYAGGTLLLQPRASNLVYCEVAP